MGKCQILETEKAGELYEVLRYVIPGSLAVPAEDSVWWVALPVIGVAL
jgi:hypothetical protein